MPPVSVVPIIFVRIPLALGSSHGVGTLEGHGPLVVHEYMLPRLVKLGVDVIQRDILFLFLFLSPISLVIIILTFGVLLAFLSRA